MEKMIAPKKDTDVGKAVWNHYFSDIFYQFDEMKYRFGNFIINSETSNYQFGFECYQFVVTIYQFSKMFRNFPIAWSMMHIIRYQFGDFVETFPKLPKNYR